MFKILFLVIFLASILALQGCTGLNQSRCDEIVLTCSTIASSLCYLVAAYPANDQQSIFQRDSLSNYIQLALVRTAKSTVFQATIGPKFLALNKIDQTNILSSYATLDSLYNVLLLRN
jgi:hypothetical protein